MDHESLNPTSPGSRSDLSAELTLSDLRSLLFRRWKTIAFVVAAALIVTVIVLIFSTREYEASGTLLVGREPSDSLNLGSVLGSVAGGAGDSLEENVTIQTQANVLSSDTLALEVIERLDLEHTAAYSGHHFSLMSLVPSFFEKKYDESPNEPLEAAPHRRTAALTIFHHELTVKPVPGTRLITVSYLDPDPVLAARVVNTLMQSLVDFNFQTKYVATTETSKWLGDQLSDLRKQSEDLQKQVITLQRQVGTYDLGGADENGHEEVYSEVLDRLRDATQAMSQAEANRILKGAVYEVAKSGNAELLSNLSGTTTAGASSSVQNSLVLLQNLREQQATLQQQESGLAAKFGPAYPRLIETRRSLDAVQASIEDEVARIAVRAKSDFEVAQHVERDTRASYEDDRKNAGALNDRVIQYQIVRQEAEQSRKLYDDLLSRLKEAGVLAGLHSSNITMVDPGRIPSETARPRKTFYLAIAVGLGLFLGGVLALIVDALDTRIGDFQSIQDEIGMAPLGVLPQFVPSASVSPDGRSRPMIQRLPVLADPQSAYAEALRALRTSLLLSRSGSPPKVILVTSSITAEGKSTTSAGLSVLLAQQRNRVLLIDVDLRRPKLHRDFDLPNASGVSSILATGLDGWEQLLHLVPEVPGLFVLNAGPIPPNPAELLGSASMGELLASARKDFDYIVMDSAPVLPVTDSVMLGRFTDAILLIARYGTTTRQSLKRSYHLLASKHGGKIVGFVLNAVDVKAAAYSEYYGYNGSNYYYQSNVEK